MIVKRILIGICFQLISIKSRMFVLMWKHNNYVKIITNIFRVWQKYLPHSKPIPISSSSCRAQAQISLTLSRHFSLSFIASGRSSGLHPVSSHSCCMYIRAGRPAFDRPYAGVHKSTSLMSSSLLLQQCPACLVRDRRQVAI